MERKKDLISQIWHCPPALHAITLQRLNFTPWGSFTNCLNCMKRGRLPFSFHLLQVAYLHSHLTRQILGQIERADFLKCQCMYSVMQIVLGAFGQIIQRNKGTVFRKTCPCWVFQNVVFQSSKHQNGKSIDLNCIRVQAGVKGMNVSKPWLMKPALAGIPGGCKISLVMIYISLLQN